YSAMGGTHIRQLEMALLWVMNLSDGGATLLDIAERAQTPFDLVEQAAQMLLRHDLLAPAP
ncbi:MAG TPA: winged helix-turn-helix domain-containing protein, partial [Ramlibacter sp.]|nr:winged helix-turn-helix domain-containing protein [Ramlibacter sp.]